MQSVTLLGPRNAGLDAFVSLYSLTLGPVTQLVAFLDFSTTTHDAGLCKAGLRDVGPCAAEP